MLLHEIGIREIEHYKCQMISSGPTLIEPIFVCKSIAIALLRTQEVAGSSRGLVSFW